MSLTDIMQHANKVHALMVSAADATAKAEAIGDFPGVVLIALNLVRDIGQASRETP